MAIHAHYMAVGISPGKGAALRADRVVLTAGGRFDKRIAGIVDLAELLRQA